MGSTRRRVAGRWAIEPLRINPNDHSKVINFRMRDQRDDGGKLEIEWLDEEWKPLFAVGIENGRNVLTMCNGPVAEALLWLVKRAE